MPTHSRTKAAWIYSGGFSVFNEWRITWLSNPLGQKLNLIFTKSGQKIDFYWAKTSQNFGQKINILSAKTLHLGHKAHYIAM